MVYNFSPDEIIVIACCSLSMIGSFLILLSFFVLQNLLKGLFARMVIYLTLSDIMQTYGILMSGPLKGESQVCQYFAALRIFGSLSLLFWSVAILWSIRQIFKVHVSGGLIAELQQENKKLESLEIQFLCICYGIPFLLVQWPLWTGKLDYFVMSSDNNQSFCYIYSEPGMTHEQVEFIDIEKSLIWEIPFFLYFIYAGYFIRQLNRLSFEQEELYKESKKIIIKQMIIPIITFFCTIWFTIDDIMRMSGFNGSAQYTTFSISMLGIWGFFNAIAYFRLERLHKHLCQKIKDILKKKQNPEGIDLTPQLQNKSDGSRESFEENQELGRTASLYRISVDDNCTGFHQLYVARLNQQSNINLSSNL